MMTKQITEEMGVHKDWYKEAKEMTLDGLPNFLLAITSRRLNDD